MELVTGDLWRTTESSALGSEGEPDHGTQAPGTGNLLRLLPSHPLSSCEFYGHLSGENCDWQDFYYEIKFLYLMSGFATVANSALIL